jgi:hypothetical protein
MVQGPIVRVSADRFFFVVLAGVGVLRPRFRVGDSHSHALSPLRGGRVRNRNLLLVGRGWFGLGLGWVQIGPEGVSGLTYRGRRVVPWQEAHFIEWIPDLGGPPGFGLNRPGLAAYRERTSGTGSGRHERLIFFALPSDPATNSSSARI